MTSSSSGSKKRKKPTVAGLGSLRPLDPRLLDLDLKFFLSPVSGLPVRVDRATDKEFDLFIRQYIEMGWTLADRLDALIAAIQGGQEPKFLSAENLGDASEKCDKNPNFLGPEPAREAKRDPITVESRVIEKGSDSSNSEGYHEGC